MKKLFTTLFVSLCGTMVYAQSVVSVNDVNIVAGSTKKMEVKLTNPSDYTAFQFDLKLPKGISVKDVSMNGTYGEDRKLEKGLINEGSNTYRFLSYDMKNSTLTGDEVVATITLEAGDEAETDNEAIVSGSDLLVVTPDGTPTEQATASATILVSNGATISIGSSEKTTFVCSSGLDFTDNDAKAYIVTGVDAKNVWMTRVQKVPANTPIVVKGSEGDHLVAMADVKGVYYQNFLIGNNTDASINVTPESGDQFLRLGTQGFSRFTDTKSVGAHKAYIRAKALPEAKTGSSVNVTIGEGLRTSLCADVDLDFTETDVKAYIATGFDGTIWLSRVMTASAGTPLYLRGAQGEYTIPSAAAQTVFANMLVGNNSESAITINATDGSYTNFFVGKSGFSKVKDTRDVSAHKSYLQILTSYLPAASRGNSDGIVIGETEAEMFRMPLGVLGEDGDGATGIRAIDEEFQSDVWYNLNGQRIDTPTRKGLYIKNGKKVIVK